MKKAASASSAKVDPALLAVRRLTSLEELRALVATTDRGVLVLTHTPTCPMCTMYVPVFEEVGPVVHGDPGLARDVIVASLNLHGPGNGGTADTFGTQRVPAIFAVPPAALGTIRHVREVPLGTSAELVAAARALGARVRLDRVTGPWVRRVLSVVEWTGLGLGPLALANAVQASDQGRPSHGLGQASPPARRALVRETQALRRPPAGASALLRAWIPVDEAMRQVPRVVAAHSPLAQALLNSPDPLRTVVLHYLSTA